MFSVSADTNACTPDRFADAIFSARDRTSGHPQSEHRSTVTIFVYLHLYQEFLLEHNLYVELELTSSVNGMLLGGIAAMHAAASIKINGTLVDAGRALSVPVVGEDKLRIRFALYGPP